MPRLQLCTPDNPATIIGPAAGGFMHDKKLCATFNFLVVNSEGIPEDMACIRVWGTPARAYASVWLKVAGDWRAGTGKAGGYGYHRGSAAVMAAFTSAGIRLEDDIGGRGESAYPGAVASALLALGESRPLYMIRGY